MISGAGKMGLRLIKKNERSASRAKAVSFSEDPAGLEKPAVCDPPWAKGFACVPAPREGAAAGQSPIRARPLDPSQVEKLAYENGLRQGEKAGMEIAERKIEALMPRFADAIAEVHKLKSKLYARAEKDVVKLALEVAKRIVHREIQADPEIIQTLVKVALSHVAVKSPATIRLHPADYSYILQHRGELTQDTEEDREVVLLADKSIERGGCLVQTECGDVDARIEEEFLEVERSFFDTQEL